MTHLVVTLKMNMFKNDHKRKPKSVARWAESQLKVENKEKGRGSNHLLLLISMNFHLNKASLSESWVITNVMTFLYSANKLRLEMKIDEILRSKKSNRPRKKKANDEVLDSFADDEVARLREAMNTAADEDIRSNNDKLPATAKLRLLPEAMDTLRKCVCTKFCYHSRTVRFH